MRARAATPDDSTPIAEIYNQGIEDRIGTFETRLRSPEDIRAWFDATHPIVVVEDDERRVIGFAATFQYLPRPCYSRIAEFAVYVARPARGRGVGRLVMQELIRQVRDAGFTKLVSRVLVENEVSRRLLRSVGFREVGIYEKHGQLDGVWHDAVIVEYLVRENIDRLS